PGGLPAGPALPAKEHRSPGSNSRRPIHLRGGSINRSRYEVVVEGTDAGELTEETEWKEYGFKGKPGDLRRLPRQYAPYHLRLDWLMWFAGISPAYARDWFGPFVERLLTGDRATLRLLRHNPFPGRPPTHVRARLYHYRFTTWRELRETGAWWHRTFLREYLPPAHLRRPEE
ncbi:lipase maturation factor family protein, partial [Streptomyces sp. NPDC049577]|uniref:lipase maturation factor family protein n=1 Tax=Streptomyces sp. NPDC049577 TaxID=3155153 RepID=UPI0034371C64